MKFNLKSISSSLLLSTVFIVSAYGFIAATINGGLSDTDVIMYIDSAKIL